VSFPFHGTRGPIFVRAVLNGSAGNVALGLILDTGSTMTMIDPKHLITAGYDLASAHSHAQVTTVSGVEYVPRITVARLTALGRQRGPMTVLGRAVPASANADGLLGLDFLRGLHLSIDFRAGQIELT